MRTKIIQVWKNLFNQGLKIVKKKGKHCLKTLKNEKHESKINAKLQFQINEEYFKKKNWN
jgi:hypothetical protein